MALKLKRFRKTYTAELNRPAYYTGALVRYIENYGFDVDPVRHKTTLSLSYDDRKLSFNDLKACLRSLMRHPNSSVLLASSQTGARWLARRSGNRPLRFVRF
jgi:hypothetical protein